MRIRMPNRATTTNTDGWAAIIGDLGKGTPRLAIWLDRFSGYANRKLYACFYSNQRQPLAAITKRVNRKLWPARTITLDDTEEEKHLRLVERLTRSEFNSPIIEKYENGKTFYGIYDPTRETAERVSPYFCIRAAAFFEDVARSLPRSTASDEQNEIFPHSENRKKVVSHIQRERSKALAAECKIRDGYQCRICAFQFEDAYGRLGREFAEAHHIVPLAKLRENVRTQVKDLVTVCSNCHRMLHRMEGVRGDVARLRKAVNCRK